MAHVKGKIPSKRLIWRITADAPLGEYVEVGGPPSAPAPPSKSAETHEGGWIESSYDLARGLEVRELSLPADPATKRPRDPAA
jgi:hypothetical protein